MLPVTLPAHTLAPLTPSPPLAPSRPLSPQLYIEAPVVIGMSYLCFWMGELVCGTSAVIAVVIMGLYVNKHRSEISADVFHFLHQFYEMASHILNTVIFAIAGAKAVVRTAAVSSAPDLATVSSSSGCTV